MNIINDNRCGWINDLDKRSNIKTLDKDKSCDWLIVVVLFGEQIALKTSNEKVMKLI